MSDALAVQHVSYAYGARRALEDVGFGVPEGEFAALLGPNGAGKTTLFCLITRLFDPQQGEVRIFGEHLSRNFRKALAQMGVVFQQPTLDLDLTVRQNLLYHAALHGLSGSAVRQRMEEGLERFEMRDRLNDKVRQLNGGHRRRVELIRTLLHRPRLLVLDEPTVGLDIPSRRSILEHVRQLGQEERLSVLWTTHLIEEIAPQDRVILLHQGRVKAEATSEVLQEQTGVNSLSEAFEQLTRKEVPQEVR
ncbi:MAG: ABC transporter ATP-binding protein [bacterium]